MRLGDIIKDETWKVSTSVDLSPAGSVWNRVCNNNNSDLPVLYSLCHFSVGPACFVCIFALRMCGTDSELAKESAEGKEPAGTAAITTGRRRMNTVYCWSCCLWTETWGIMTWIGNRTMTEAWTLHPQQDRKYLLGCLLGRTSLDSVTNSTCAMTFLSYYSKLQPRQTVPGCNWTQVDWGPLDMNGTLNGLQLS